MDTQRVVDALSSPVRREILWMVWDRELTVGDINRSFHLRAPTISAHLTTLRAAGLVSMRVDGTFRRYRADQSAISGIRRLLPAIERQQSLRGERESTATTRTMAVAAVEIMAPCHRVDAFRAFTDATHYSRWAGASVTLVDGRFCAEMANGRRVRGTYDHVVEPSLIVMTWDYEDGQVPLPGNALRAYLEFFDHEEGCHLVLHQIANNDSQARYFAQIWSVMLQRFRAGSNTADNPLADPVK